MDANGSGLCDDNDIAIDLILVCTEGIRGNFCRQRSERINNI